MSEDRTFDALPEEVGSLLYKGAHVRQYMSKKRTKVYSMSGEVLYFVHPTIKGVKVWRALVAWRPEDADHTDQFVDINLLRLENTPPPNRNLDETDEADPELNELFKFCADCGGDLEFDPDRVGDTCGGLTLRGWYTCKKCGKGWLADQHDPDPTKRPVNWEDWKLVKGGRSVETGNGRIRVDGGHDVEGLMARILKLPELELEVARLRKLETQVTKGVCPACNGSGGGAFGPPPPDTAAEAFRTLQHRVYDILISHYPREYGEKEACEILLKVDALKSTNEHELAAAIRYAMSWGRMP